MCRPFSHVGVGGAVETIAPYSILLVQFKRNSVEKCHHGNSLVERSIEHGNLWYIGKNCFGNFNTCQIRGIMQRGKGDILFDYSDNLIINNGFGTLYEAENIPYKRKVILKILKNSSERKRFEHEIKVVSHFKHPNIAVLYQAGEYQGIHFITHESIGKGFDLSDYIK